MARGRLDNGRSGSSSKLLQSVTSQEAVARSMRAAGAKRAAAPQTSALSFDLLDRLLNTHNWSTYRDAVDEITAIHVETKEGQDRFKHILGIDELSGSIALLGKQRLLRGEFRVSPAPNSAHYPSTEFVL